jgi:hypothetical protein
VVLQPPINLGMLAFVTDERIWALLIGFGGEVFNEQLL